MQKRDWDGDQSPAPENGRIRQVAQKGNGACGRPSSSRRVGKEEDEKKANRGLTRGRHVARGGHDLSKETRGKRGKEGGRGTPVLLEARISG